MHQHDTVKHAELTSETSKSTENLEISHKNIKLGLQNEPLINVCHKIYNSICLHQGI